MILSVRGIAVTCAAGALGAALAACGGPANRDAGHRGHHAPATTSTAISATPSQPPTLAPGPAGLTPVFKNGPRTRNKTVALTFDADMTADQGSGRRPASVSTIRG